jgi:peptidoglycan hydrolase-like protein with peptidoglycan-binding domain
MRRRWLFLAVICLAPLSLLCAEGIIESAQQALKDQGFYYGEINGQKNADTTAAIRRYQVRNGLKVTGELDADTQRSLGLASGGSARGKTTAFPAPTEDLRDSSSDARTERVAPLPSPGDGAQRTPFLRGYAPEPHGIQPEISGVFDGTPYETAPPDLQQRVIVGAQTMLARRGCYRGEIDGVSGRETEFSLRAYQAQIGLAVTGRLDMPTLAALGLLPGQHLPAHRRATPFGSRPVYRGEWMPE